MTKSRAPQLSLVSPVLHLTPRQASSQVDAADWAARFGAGERFSPAAEQLVEVARVLDRIYGC